MKKTNLANLQIKLDPVNSQISELEKQRSRVNDQLNEQLNL